MNWFKSRREERELGDEIREHIRIETQENIERGMAPDEQVHEMRIGLFFETVAQDAPLRHQNAAAQ